MISSVPRRVTILVLTIVLAGLAGPELLAQVRTTGPVRTAVVNMKEVLDGYRKRTDYETALKELAGRNQAELQARQDELRDLQNRARNLMEHQVDERRRLIDQFTRKQIELEVQKQLLEFKHRRQYVTWFTEIKDDIRQASAAVAKEKNFDMVMAATPEEPEAETVQNFDFSLGDKLLYYSGAIDITADVLTRLNKDYLTEN